MSMEGELPKATEGSEGAAQAMSKEMSLEDFQMLALIFRRLSESQQVKSRDVHAENDSKTAEQLRQRRSPSP